jgi:hypothetical protein
MDKSAPIKEEHLKTYILPVEIEQEDDGRWSAEVPALPGCAAVRSTSNFAAGRTKSAEVISAPE